MKINIFDNGALKLVSLVLAIIIWFLVVGEQKSEVRLTVPLELRNLPTDLEIIDSIREVDVTLRGFSSFVKRLTSSDVDVHTDLSNVVEGTNSFLISPDDITVPVGAAVIQVSPSHVEVSLDAIIIRLVPVEPITRGSPADGYVLDNVRAEPNIISVAGAQSLIKSLKKVETEVVMLNEATEDLTKKVKIRLPNNSLRLEKKEEDIVEVRVKIVPEMTSRFFEDIPLRIEGEKRKFTVVPDSITALVQGPKLRILQMSPKDIPAFIETEALSEGQSVVQVHFKLPELMDVKVYYPKTIIIEISKNEE